MRSQGFLERRVFISGAVILIVGFYGVFFFYPLFIGVGGSLFKWNPLAGEKLFIGFKNYSRLFQDFSFIIALRNTIIFTFFSVLGKTAIGLLAVVIIQSLGKGTRFFRAVYFLPVITPIVAISIVWKWFYHPRVGLLNAFLSIFGIEAINWLGNPSLVIPSVIVMTIWKDLGYGMIIFIAALINVPASLYEAARIDGVNRFQNFFHITLPSIRQTLIFVVITSLIGDFQAFVQIFVMTKGGPGNASSVISYLIYKRAFQDFQFGYASAISVILFFIIMSVTFLQYTVLKRERS